MNNWVEGLGGESGELEEERQEEKEHGEERNLGGDVKEKGEGGERKTRRM